MISFQHNESPIVNFLLFFCIKNNLHSSPSLTSSSFWGILQKSKEKNWNIEKWRRKYKGDFRDTAQNTPKEYRLLFLVFMRRLNCYLLFYFGEILDAWYISTLTFFVFSISVYFFMDTNLTFVTESSSWSTSETIVWQTVDEVETLFIFSQNKGAYAYLFADTICCRK